MHLLTKTCICVLRLRIFSPLPKRLSTAYERFHKSKLVFFESNEILVTETIF